MIRKWIDVAFGMSDLKRRYRAYKARIRKLPPAYRDAAKAIERYLTRACGVTDGAAMVTMLEDLADLFEQSVADGSSLRAVVGENPVEFADEFLANYVPCQWNDQEKARLSQEIARVAGDEGSAR